MNEEAAEIRQRREEKERLEKEEIKKSGIQAMGLLKENGMTYLNQYGPGRVNEEIEKMKENIRTWNIVSGGSLVFNLQSVNTMLFILSTVNRVNPEFPGYYAYKEFYLFVCAARNKFIQERDEQIKKDNPELSTP